MEKFATENLILLEFLVESVTFDCSERNDLQVMSGETQVSFQFLDNAPLLVTEDEFRPSRKDMCPDTTSNVKHGKSCLFSLTPKQAERALYHFDIFVEIYKKMKPGMLPEKVKIGESLISIVNIFKDLMDAIIKRQETTSAKVMKDMFKITNLGGEVIGKIKVFVRVSCFGKLIVTQFQMNLESKSVEFKAKEGHYMFKYDKKDGRCLTECADNKPSQTVARSCAPPGCAPSPSCPLPPCSSPRNCLSPSGSHSSPCPSIQCYPFPPPCFPPPPPCFPPPPPCCPPSPPCSPVACRPPPCSPCSSPPSSPRRPSSAPVVQNPCCMTPCEIYQMQMAASQPPSNPGLPYTCCDKFQEIGASMGKNAVTIRVRKEANTKVEPWNGDCNDEDADDEEEFPAKCNCINKKKGRSKSSASPKCLSSPSFSQSPRSCSVPRCCNAPPQTMSQCSSASQSPRPQCPPPSCCSTQPPPSCCPSQCIPPSCCPSQPPLSCCPPPQCPPSECCPPAKVLTYPQCPPAPACYPPPCCRFPCPPNCPIIQKKCDDDPEKETFILKIGKKNEGSCCKQNDLELEVCTPKGKEIKPAPQKCCQATQYSLIDIPEDYLEAFYGKEKWKKMKKEQADEEAKIRKTYGSYGFGEDTSNTDERCKKKKKAKGKGDGDAKVKPSPGGGAGVYIERQIYVPCDPCNPCNPCMPCNPCYNPCATISTCHTSCYR